MEITQFKQLATDMVKIKAEIKTLQDQYDTKKQEVMDAYEILGVKTYEIEGTWIKIAKKTRTTMQYAEWVEEKTLLEEYPDYVVIKKSLDKKKLQKEVPTLFTAKVTEFVSVTWM